MKINENIIGGQRENCQTLPRTHYNAIDGLRALSCLGIILMHIQANTKYYLSGNFFLIKLFLHLLGWFIYS